jgi:adenosylcobinamide kinase/adenosylcobinamide-phosphate guanylyltransferase
MENITLPFRVALVLGGARSGKSRYGLGLAGRCPAPRLFVATCEPRDAEMEARIAAHQRERGSDWNTQEVPLELAATLNAAQDSHGVILVDCLTMWVSNLLLQEGAPQGPIQTACEALVDSLERTVTPTILISNEVGMGIVPDNPLSREFRDQAGWLHQRLAQVADLVVLVVAGIPLPVKVNFPG